MTGVVAGSVARPIVLVTGAAGNLGRSVAGALAADYQIVGLDRKVKDGAPTPGFPILEVDLTADASVALALRIFRDSYGSRIASVVHLAAYFDFTGEDNPQYHSVNVEGTQRLLRALQGFEVEQFVYASTMLVHAPCRPGEHIDETQPIAPGWAYPKSKAAAEAVVREERGDIASVILRLAGVYDVKTMVPTLAQQVARVYERDLQSHLYAGSTLVGQSALHRDDMLDALRRTVDRRGVLPHDTEMLIGEADALGYEALQDALGQLMHGTAQWLTLRVPKPLAAVGAWVQGQLEPLVPDAIDGGEPPFIRPFMVAMADDHFALDIRRARSLLDWEPRHRLKDDLPQMVAALKADPAAWYAANGITAPGWVTQAGGVDSLPSADEPAHPTPATTGPPQIGQNPDTLRTHHDMRRKGEHSAWRWAHMVNIGLGSWLLTQPLLVGVQEPWLRGSEMILGFLLMIAASLALSWRAVWARWLCAGIGAAVVAVPFLWSTASAAAYLSDTLVGALVFGLAVCSKPEPGSSAVAALSGPSVPPGWSYNPSGWAQRLPIIVLALLGLYVSRYLAGYQLGHIPALWDPFFDGSATDPRNGTEEIVTSWVSTALPVSDAALGGYTYLLEILTGLVGSRQRWRTAPWLVLLFGLMIVPLGMTTILFIVIQPVVLGTWSTLALVGGAAVLLQIPYSLDELLATCQFLRRRAKAGKPWLRVLFLGDTDDMSVPGDAKPVEDPADEFDRPPGAVLKAIVGGGVSLPWNLALAGMIGLSLLFTRVTLGADGGLADAHHIFGSLVLTVVSIAAADVARPARALNVLLGVGLIGVPFLFDGSSVAAAVTFGLGIALVLLSIRRGPIQERYGNWNRWLV